MKSVCANCDLGLTRSECSDVEYVECELRRWIIEEIKYANVYNLICVLDETLEDIYKNENDLRNVKLKMIKYLCEVVD